VLTGAAAALVAGTNAATAGDPIFAARKRETVAAWDALQNLYEKQERLIKAIGPRPSLPERLLEPMRLPRKSGLTEAPEDGWTTTYLANLVRTGVDLTAETTKTAHGATMRTEWKPISAKTRNKAAELLVSRRAYDAECTARMEKIHAIEETSREPLDRVINLALALMAYPVFTLAEVRDKLAIAEEYDLYNLTDDGDGMLQQWLLRDALAIAEKAVAHV
jgi:hypothetical protein